MPKVVAPRLGTLKGAEGTAIKVDFSLLTVGSVLFDAVYVPGGDRSVEALRADARAVLFVHEAYKHCKAVAATGGGAALLPDRADASGQRADDDGVALGTDGQVGKVAADFIKAIAQHRSWSREARAQRVAA